MTHKLACVLYKGAGTLVAVGYIATLPTHKRRVQTATVDKKHDAVCWLCCFEGVLNWRAQKNCVFARRLFLHIYNAHRGKGVCCFLDNPVVARCLVKSFKVWDCVVNLQRGVVATVAQSRNKPRVYFWVLGLRNVRVVVFVFKGYATLVVHRKKYNRAVALYQQRLCCRLNPLLAKLLLGELRLFVGLEV